MTELEMLELKANSKPGRRSEFIREAIKAAIKRKAKPLKAKIEYQTAYAEAIGSLKET